MKQSASHPVCRAAKSLPVGIWHPSVMQFYSGPLIHFLSGVDRGRRRIPQSRLVRMIRDEAGWIMPENDCEAVAEFIRTKGITRCPTACVLPTQGLVAAADRIALEEHAIARDQLRRAQTAARWRPF